MTKQHAVGSVDNFSVHAIAWDNFQATCPNLDFFQPGSDNLLYILKKKWWKYILLGLADVEANYLIVRAYQYTTLTSVQVRRSPLTSLDFLALREDSELISAHLISLRTCSLKKTKSSGCYLVSSGACVLMRKASWN